VESVTSGIISPCSSSYLQNHSPNINENGQESKYMMTGAIAIR
jgi:hypothetical protein